MYNRSRQLCVCRLACFFAWIFVRFLLNMSHNTFGLYDKYFL